MPTPRKCSICKKNYYYCPHCGHDNPSETWRNSFCSENCRQIFKICQSYVLGEIKPAEAQKKIQELDIKGIENFAKVIRGNIIEILSYKPKTRKKKNVND